MHLCSRASAQKHMLVTISKVYTNLLAFLYWSFRHKTSSVRLAIISMLSCSRWFVLITRRPSQCMHHGQVIVWDPRLARGAVVLHRDANHQACAAGMIKCHTAPSLLALTVNKASPPTSWETVTKPIDWTTRSHSDPYRHDREGTNQLCLYLCHYKDYPNPSK